jgi:hypothetical protein
MEQDFDPDIWKQQKAQKVIDLMQRHNVTAGLMENIEITALVLEMLSERLPADLIGMWAYEHRDLIEEMMAGIAQDQEF